MNNKIGVFVCECGPNISTKVDIARILEEVKALPGFDDAELLVKNHKLLCSADGKAFLEREIKENELTHLVVAACSPRDHNSTFMSICQAAELNPYLYTMVNIREHCAWVIPDMQAATDKAVEYIRAGMSRVLYQNPLFEKQLESNPDVLVIGGGTAGITAALTLAGPERKVFLVEKTSSLGGKAVKFNRFLPRQGIPIILKNKIREVEKNPQIIVYKETELKNIVGFLGNFEVELENKTNGQIIELMAGGVILANGYSLLNASTLPDYNYAEKDNVFTTLEIEEMLSENGSITLKNGQEPKSAVLIHCVGRKEAGYCSAICCSYLLKTAEYLKDQNEEIKVTHLHRDLCLPYKEDEAYFHKVKERGVKFIRIAEIKVNGNKIQIKQNNGEDKEIEPDMIIIAPAMQAAADNEVFAEALNLEQHETGFYQEAHIKINPVSTVTEGVFVAGACRGACDISNAETQAKAACGKILTQLRPGEKIIPEVKVSEVLEAYCTGCKTCLEVCGFGAIYFDDVRGVSVVNEAICRGCGNCVGSCPSGAIRSRHFTSEQLYQQVKEALR